MGHGRRDAALTRSTCYFPLRTGGSMATLSRREAILAGAMEVSAGVVGLAQGRGTTPAPVVGPQQRAVNKGRLKQSVSRWCYQSIPMPDFCKACSELGLTAIDLLEEPEWAVVRDHGLICSMGYAGGGSIRDGLNVTANHDAIVRNFAMRSIRSVRAMRSMPATSLCG